MGSLRLSLTMTVLLFSSPLAEAEEGTGKISGRVLEPKTRQPLPGVNVIVVGTGRGAATDLDGYYAIINMPPGSYTVQARFMGCKTLTVRNVQVVAGITTTVNFQLEPVKIEIDSHRRPRRYFGDYWWNTSSSTVVWEMPTRWLQRGRFLDLEAILDILPGVVRGKDGHHVRGGRNTDSPWQMEGLSLTDPLYGNRALPVSLSAVRAVNVTTSTHDVESRSSEALDIIPEKGGPFHLAGEATIAGEFPYRTEESASYDSDLWLRGSLLRRRQLGFFCSVQASSSPSRFLPALSDENKGTSFLDLCWSVSRNKRIQLNAVGSIHRYDPYDHRWIYNPSGLPRCWEKSHLTTLTWYHHPINSAYYNLKLRNLTIAQDLKVNGKNWEDYLAPSSDRYGDIDPYFFTRGDYPVYHKSKESIYFGDGFLEARVSRINQVKMGIELRQYLLELDRKEFSDTLLNEIEYIHKPSSFALFLQDRIERRGMIMTIGTRLDGFNPATGSEVKLHLLPRMGVSFPITGEGKIFLSYGRFGRIPPYRFLRPERVGWQDSSPVFGNPDLGFEETVAYQVGAQRVLLKRLLGSVSIFRRESRGLLAVVSRPGYWKEYLTFLNEGRLDSRGLECAVEAVYWKYLRGQINYTYSITRGDELETNRWDELSYYHQLKNPHPSWDRRHSISGDIYLEFRRRGKIEGGEIGMSGRYGSGFPYYLEEEEYVSSPYLALDFFLRSNFRIFGFQQSAFVNLLNLLDRKNVLEVDEFTGEPGGLFGDPTHWGERRRIVLGASIGW